MDARGIGQRGSPTLERHESLYAEAGVGTHPLRKSSHNTVRDIVRRFHRDKASRVVGNEHGIDDH